MKETERRSNEAPLTARAEGNHAASAEKEAMQDGERQAFLWQTHGYLAEYARFADTKAGFAGTLAGTLIGCLYGAGLFASLVKTPVRQWTWQMWSTASGGLMLCFAVFLAVRVVYPRLKHTKKTGVIFWESIAALGTAAKFKASFRAKTGDDLTEALELQVFDVAKFVLMPKYRYVSLCLWALMLGAMLAGTALLFKDAGKTGATSQATQTLQAPVH